MTLLSCGIKRKNGFTLVELLVTAAVMSFLLICICSTYFSVAAEWERQQGGSNATVAASMACSRLATYISQSVSATAINRFGTGDALAVNMPSDTAYNSYIPVWSSGLVQYRSGSWIVFYLSDSTGSYAASGNILWAGSTTQLLFPLTVTPDSSWSLQPGSQRGNISPIKSLSFSVDGTGGRPKVTITVASSYKVKNIDKSYTLSRTVCVRNYK